MSVSGYCQKHGSYLQETCPLCDLETARTERDAAFENGMLAGATNEVLLQQIFKESDMAKELDTVKAQLSAAIEALRCSAYYIHQRQPHHGGDFEQCSNGWCEYNRAVLAPHPRR